MYDLIENKEDFLDLDVINVNDLKNNEIFMQQLYQKINFDGLKIKLEEKSIKININKIKVTAAAFDYVFILKEVILPIFVGILSMFLYDKLKAESTRPHILIRTEKREFRFYGEKNLERYIEEIKEFFR